MVPRQKLGYNQGRVLKVLQERPVTALSLFELNDLMGDHPGTRNVIRRICDSLIARGLVREVTHLMAVSEVPLVGSVPRLYQVVA